MDYKIVKDNLKDSFEGKFNKEFNVKDKKFSFGLLVLAVVFIICCIMLIKSVVYFFG